jgi:dTDP-4-amino-4,6-dideoxygalactose transaminase
MNPPPTSARPHPIPLLDLRAQYASIKPEIDAAMQDVMSGQQFILGEKVGELERRIAAYSGAAHAVGVSSGTDALLVSLMALEIGPGDEVITPAFTFFASASTVRRVGARPVFVDIDPVTFNLDPAAVADAAGERTRAIIPVHLFGQCAEMPAVMEIAHRHDLGVIEDAAQAIGARCRWPDGGEQVAGAMGTLGVLSFFPSKNLGGIGDGGMVLGRDAELMDKIRALRMHGEVKRYYHRWIGGNFRLDTLQAAALLVKLRHLDRWTEARRRNADLYRALFAEARLSDDPVRLPAETQPRHVYHQFVIRVPRRGELMEHLRSHDIGCAIYYPLPLHRQECFADLGYRRGQFPWAESAADEVLALPIYPELSDEDQARVVQTIGEFYRRR